MSDIHVQQFERVLNLFKNNKWTIEKNVGVQKKCLQNFVPKMSSLS